MSEEPEDELPASLAAAWGQRRRPQRGPRPGLTLDRIVAAAVSVAASEGLSAVSMSRVATALGASTMSLYRYVAAKDELLALMLDQATGAPPPTPSDVEGWRAGLTHWASSMRLRMREHPWVAHLPISGPPITPRQIEWLEAGLTHLAETRLAAGEKLSTIMLVSGYVWREATLEADIMAAMKDNKWLRLTLNYGATLAKLIDEQRFPEVNELVQSTAFDESDDPDAEFTFGLNRILDGVDRLIQSRGDATVASPPAKRRADTGRRPGTRRSR